MGYRCAANEIIACFNASIMEEVDSDASVTVTEDNSNVSDAGQYDTDDINHSNADNPGLFLLKKLQQLKVWQARQEAMLLEEQRQQISWKLNEVAAGKVEQEHQVADTEDDTAISSLESDHEEQQV